ncbi:unnamed protein product [Allacma fusca]|uniref:Uncharacterized protein n=1 Tax=Allacma fusca TaxID=39272 RepID=A0A8J2LQG0_9HEXA|nr:unnamed protein product [Allacma fusca]
MKQTKCFLIHWESLLLAIFIESKKVGSFEHDLYRNSQDYSSHIIAFNVPLELFHWQSFKVILGKESTGYRTRDFLERFERLLRFYEADVEVIHADQIEFHNETANQELTPSARYFGFFKPDEFIQLSLKVPKFPTHRWIIVNNSSIHDWLQVLQKFRLSLDSNIYLVNDSNSEFYQVLEIYKICSTCSVQVSHVCSINRTNGVLQGKFCNVEKYQRRQNLQGFTVRAIALTVNPFDVNAVLGPNKTWCLIGGMWVEIFRILETEFNISTTVEILQGYKFGKFDPVTKTWDGILGAVSSGQVDISLNPLSLAVDRVPYIDYAISVHSVGIRIYIRRSVESKKIHWSFFTNPFSRNLLFAVFLCCSSLAVIMQLVVNARPNKDKIFNFYNTCWIMLAALCQKGSHITPDSPSAKLIFILAYLTFLIVFCAYSATLTSQLSVPQSMKLPFKNLKELLTARGWSGGPIRGDFTYNVMEKTCPEILATSTNSSLNSQCTLLTHTWKTVVEPIKPLLPSNFAEGLNKSLREKFAFITTVTGARYILNTEMRDSDACQIYEINKDTLSSNLGLAFRKQFPLRKLFNYQ